MSAVLFSKTGLFAGTSFNIANDASIGKSDNNSVVLRSEIVSSQHARISYDDSQKAYFLEDLGSSNGTLLDGIKVKGKERLERLHIITFAGKFDFIFQVGGVAPVKAAPHVPSVIQEQKTVFDKGTDAPAALPSFGKKEEKLEEKTMFDAGMEAPARLPKFGRPAPEPKSEEKKEIEKTVFDKPAEAPSGLPSFSKPKEEKEVEKTSFDSGQGAPSGLPKFDAPKDDEKTIAAKVPDSTPPAFQKKPEPPAPPPPSDIERTAVMKQPPTPPPSAKPGFMLSVGKLNKEFELKDGQTSIGRTIGCDIIIDDVSMSRKHAMITVSAGKVMIKDLGSSNGTSIDKKRISSEIEITPSSNIRLGMVEVKIKKVI